MNDFKIAVIGAGSFVFGPSLLHQILVENQLDRLDLALVDVDPDALDLMAAVGRRMADSAGVTVDITTHTDRAAALTGADFVVSAAAREMHRRFEMDRAIITAHLPGHLLSEFGGIAGISYSLRQIALGLEIANDMQRYCRSAIFMTVSNPLPRVCQAVHLHGIRTIGFCSVALEAYRIAWKLMTGEDIGYPFTPATDRWTIRTAGLNHFTWLVDIRDNDGSDGLDRMEDLRAALDQGATSGNPYSESLYRQTGFLLIPSDDHTRDFLLPRAGGESLEEPSHGTPQHREARRQQLAAVAEGREPFDRLLEHPSWERPGDLIRALRDGSHVRFHGLNLPNQGQLPGVQEGVFVETPAFAEHYTIQAETIQLPPTVLALCQRTALVTDTIVRGALHHSRTIVHQAVELDPTVVDKRAGFAAIDACMEAHADLIGAYT